MPDPAISVRELTHDYGDRRALDAVSFDVAPGEIVGLLGPNGSGKTTLFRLLATLLPVRDGSAAILGRDVAADPAGVRAVIGITFQSPSLDGKLKVAENLRHHGHLYGLTGSALADRIDRATTRLKIADRLGDFVDDLSGGLKRRVEIAKSLLHDPAVLLLDEPSTGLDPAARHDLWTLLEELRAEAGMTLLVTTHLMEEAERCDRLAILDAGKVVALGTPSELKASVGGDCVTVESADPEGAASLIAEKFGTAPRRVGRSLRIEMPDGHELIGPLAAALGDAAETVTLGRPTLEDVFIARTGHRFAEAAAAETAA